MKFLLLLTDECSSNSIIDCDDMQETIELHDNVEDSVAISYHAMSGCLALKTLRFKGIMGNSIATVLIDFESTHNFVQQKPVKHLNLPILSSLTFQVMINNGSKLICEGQCVNVEMVIQRLEFCETFYVLPIQGAKVMFEGQWLKTFGPVTIDFTRLTWILYKMGQDSGSLNGDSLVASPISHHQLRRLVKTNFVASYFHLVAQ